ncbi:maltose acetyltransferase domain-containing protein [Moheibacter sp.]|uniref:maltose acetyltransferase domain-containing protein n=1 Tax=Moheibacter sp. TaxID=1965316 RepID=UPI003C7145FC
MMNNLTEKEKMLSGELYDAGDAALVEERQRSKDLCFRNNQILPSKMKERKGIIKTLFGKTEKMFLIEQPFYCDYGYNIEIGEQTTHHKPNQMARIAHFGIQGRKFFLKIIPIYFF